MRAQTEVTIDWRVPNSPMFIRLDDGQTAFYLHGPCFSGYLVPDRSTEWALQDAIKKFKGMETTFSYVMAIPLGFSIFNLGGSQHNKALAVLTATLVVAALGRIIQRRLCFGKIVAVLQGAQPLCMKIRRVRLFLFSCIVISYFSYVGWHLLPAIRAIIY
jgi:hypothetical protein